MFSRNDFCAYAGIWQFCIVLALLPYCYALQPTTLGVHIVRSPESAVAPKGDEVVFECELNLAPERLDWRFRHSETHRFQNIQTQNEFNITNEERVSKLRIYVSLVTLGDYQCVAWFGSAAIASTSAHLTLASISSDNNSAFNRNAIRWSLSPKNCLLIRCGNVFSNPSAIWSFYRNEIKLPVLDVQPLDGTLILNSVSAKDSGIYTCSAMNAITGMVIELPQRIDVRVDYSDRTPPYFLTQPPAFVTARLGETVILECAGVGSPPPVAVWSSPQNDISINRTKTLHYGLQIVNIQAKDQGTYVCRLDNGIAPVLVHIIKLDVLEKPQILRGPATTLTNEGDQLELECAAIGNPKPIIYWLINGEDTSLDNGTFREDRQLIINAVQKRHAGIVQCFAKNDLGETSDGSLLQVNPKQIQGEPSVVPLGHVPPVHSSYEHSGNRNKGKRKHTKAPNMIPPSRPNVTRLSDDSVMLRWFIPKTDGPSLPIQFFKVQYRMVGDSTRPRNWQTSNENIPSYTYGKHNQNEQSNNVKNFTSSVSGLKPDRFYRFRIIAVYSNNDNKEGNTSAKFFLQRESELGPSKSKLPPPKLVSIEPISEVAVILRWALATNETIDSSLVDGFYAYYRPTSSAGEYLKATVDGINTRAFKIDMLEPDTAYEFKLQSFNALAASDFSTIVQGKTRATKPTRTTSTVPPKTNNESAKSMYPVIAGAAGGGVLLVLTTLAVCLCVKKRKKPEPSGENKPQMSHIQTDFVAHNVLGISANNKSGHRMNAMTITSNPLAHEADKNRNVMELRRMSSNDRSGTTTINNELETVKNALTENTNTMQAQQRHSSASCETLELYEGATTNSTSSIGKNPLLTKQTKITHQTPLSPSNTARTHSQHHTNAQDEQSYNLNNSSQAQFGSISSQGVHLAQPYQSPPTPSLLPKRTKHQKHHVTQPVPQSQNNNHQHSHNVAHHQQQPSSPLDQHRRALAHCSGNRNMLQYAHPPHDSSMSIDGLPARIPSLRRTHRSSGNGNNNNGGVGIPIMMSGSPCVQRSPMPTRSVMQRSRLGSQNNENISSGSLNSIEV